MGSIWIAVYVLISCAATLAAYRIGLCDKRIRGGDSAQRYCRLLEEIERFDGGPSDEDKKAQRRTAAKSRG